MMDHEQSIYLLQDSHFRHFKTGVTRGVLWTRRAGGIGGMAWGRRQALRRLQLGSHTAVTGLDRGIDVRLESTRRIDLDQRAIVEPWVEHMD